MSENRKNVLLISTDHWSRYLMGCAGHSTIMTPTLDQMARQGIRFTNLYSTCPVCIPARRSLMTGTFPSTHGDRVYSDRMTMPNVTTLAQAFRDAGYQAYAVGKLHVYPQRNRLGFDDVVLMEEGRYEFGNVDDYQIWLGENGYAGEEFMHCMGNNSYLTRPWHLPESAHPTVWATREMCRQIKRKDPTRPAFYYISYQFHHPPLVPLRTYLDMYSDEDIDMPAEGLDDWIDESAVITLLKREAEPYSRKEILLAKKAFYAQCTLIDHQIRLLIGTLRECNLLQDTVIGFLSDHGDSLFRHDLVGKRTFYHESANVPFILTGQPIAGLAGTVTDKLACLEDVMPTLLSLCGCEVPSSVEGIDLLSDASRDMLYGEIGEGLKATRMATDGRHKLIYYPNGNLFHFFDLERDPDEHHNAYFEKEYAEVIGKLERYMIEHLHGNDLSWLENGRLVGYRADVGSAGPDFALYNQRGLHWPAPEGYSNAGLT